MKIDQDYLQTVTAIGSVMCEFQHANHLYFIRCADTTT